jgi:GMP synthase-like glutamine amidotransferase
VRAIVLQHDGDPPPELLVDWAGERGVELTLLRAQLEKQLGDPTPFDFAIVLGSVAHADHRAERWVADEIEWLRAADARSLPILGLCFGAQVLAAALGGSVREAPRIEIGWISVQTDLPALIEPGPWYSWHEDVIDLPPHAVDVARNDVCTQAYTIGPHLGLQFHPEVTAALAASWAAEPDALEQFERAGVDPEEFARETERAAPMAREPAFRLFDAFLARARAHDERRAAEACH